MTKSEQTTSDQCRDEPSTPYIGYLTGALIGVGVLVVLVRALLPLLQVALPALAGWWGWKRYRRMQQNRHDNLNTLFYQLLQEHQGRVTVLDFSMTAKIPAIAARRYLDAKAREFCGDFEATDRGDIIYLFTTLSASYPAREPARVAAALEPLTQTALARRLGVSPGTIRRKKLEPDLTEWSRRKDPNGVGWSYLVQSRRFFPEK